MCTNGPNPLVACSPFSHALPTERAEAPCPPSFESNTAPIAAEDSGVRDHNEFMADSHFGAAHPLHFF